MQLPAGQGHGSGRWARFRPLGRSPAAAVLVAVGELHQAHRRQPRTHREDVGVRVDLRLLDAERAQQLRRRHVDLAGPGAPVRGVDQVHAGVLQRDHAGRAELGGDVLRDLRRGRYLGIGRVVDWSRRAAVAVAWPVDDELVGREVRAGVVEGVGEPGGACHADDDRDQRAEADRRQRRPGPGPVPCQIAQREPYRDRAPPPGGGDHRQERRGQQHDGDGERDEADDEFQRPVVLASAAASRSPGRAEQEERADQEAETDQGSPGGGSSSARAGGRPARPPPGPSRSSSPAGRRRSRSR